MGHVLFVVLHLLALFGASVFLFVTVPAHLIYAVLRPRRPAAPAETSLQLTHVRCPDCRELVLAEATKCKHCGTKLVPVDLAPVRQAAARGARQDNLAKLIVAIIVAIVIGGTWGMMKR